MKGEIPANPAEEWGAKLALEPETVHTFTALVAAERFRDSFRHCAKRKQNTSSRAIGLDFHKRFAMRLDSDKRSATRVGGDCRHRIGLPQEVRHEMGLQQEVRQEIGL